MRRPILGDTRFANSDIELIKVFVYFCRDVLEILNIKVRLRLYVSRVCSFLHYEKKINPLINIKKKNPK
jgi:hypothetical protein